MYGVIGVVTLATYWRLPPGSTHHFAGSGWSGGGSRLVSYSNFPVALGARVRLDADAAVLHFLEPAVTRA